MRDNAVITHIRELCDEHSWSCYKLAKESGIAYSTLNTMFRKTNTPSVETIEKICHAFGITLAQFFASIDEPSQPDRKTVEHLRRWERLTPNDQDEVDRYTDYILAQQKDGIGSAV